MIYIEDTIVEIEAGTVDDQTAQEVYRNLQVLYGTETGEQALDREFGHSLPWAEPACHYVEFGYG